VFCYLFLFLLCGVYSLTDSTEYSSTLAIIHTTRLQKRSNPLSNVLILINYAAMFIFIFISKNHIQDNDVERIHPGAYVSMSATSKVAIAESQAYKEAAVSSQNICGSMLFCSLLRCAGLFNRTPKRSAICLFSPPKIVTPRVVGHRAYTSQKFAQKEVYIEDDNNMQASPLELQQEISTNDMPPQTEGSPKKKQRGRKVTEPKTYVIEDVEKKKTNFKGRLGYVSL